MEALGEGIGGMIQALVWLIGIGFLLGVAFGYWCLPWVLHFFAAHWH